MKNEGKVFEQCFENSIDKEKILVKRFNDNAASFSGGANTRFTSTNECDYELFEPESRTLYFLELKSTIGSLTYWREDFGKGSYNIKQNQIKGLSRFDKYKGTVCGLIFNFRIENNPTFFVPINKFVKYTSTLSKKSINIKDVLQMNPIEITSHIKRTKYGYDVMDFIEKTKLE